MGNRLGGFRRGLEESGHTEGQTVAIEYRWAESRMDRLPDLVVDLVQRRVDIIVTSGGVIGAFAAKAATPSIPIIFLAAQDPVKLGLVGSLARPGGNRSEERRVGKEGRYPRCAEGSGTGSRDG